MTFKVIDISTVLFVSISQVIGCGDRLRNDLYCVGWGVKLYSNQTKPLILVPFGRTRDFLLVLFLYLVSFLRY